MYNLTCKTMWIEPEGNFGKLTCKLKLTGFIDEPSPLSPDGGFSTV